MREKNRTCNSVQLVGLTYVEMQSILRLTVILTRCFIAETVVLRSNFQTKALEMCFHGV